METLRNIFGGRPLWMNGVMIFCAYMTFIYMPFDMFFKPVEKDQEVWFGIMLTGWAAKATEPFHWLIYGFGLYGFLKMKRWMWPWASLYVVQIAIGMVVWSVLDERARGPLIGLVVAGPFLFLAWGLMAKRDLFNEGATQSNEEVVESESE